jgi:hypothetical protein
MDDYDDDCEKVAMENMAQTKEKSILCLNVFNLLPSMATAARFRC